MFSKHGFDGVSIRNLAKHANINIAMVSYYFGSKENLYISVIERKMVTIRQYLTEDFLMVETHGISCIIL
ncbi:MAG: TetR/AcrR family transcriptional regulator [Sphingobacteriales bacterium JAD_PAG50586_3]|nr:MAG: TetR/AcrR family transcriptional regulator [Sphingobacteriales bacterium JAD_PAG50586_3]